MSIAFRPPLKHHEVPLPEVIDTVDAFTHDMLEEGYKNLLRTDYEIRRRKVEEMRLLILTRAKSDPDFRATIYEICKRDTQFFIDHFCYTFDDREDAGAVPLIPYDFQIEKFIKPYDDMCATKAPARSTKGVAKSRATGFTWLSMASRLKAFLFHDNWSILIGAENREDVDDGGQTASQQSLFGKLRFMIRHLPQWMVDDLLGPLFKKEEFNKRWVMINPRKRRNIIHGKQLGGMFGRSRRYSEVFADEVAWSEEMKDADTSLKQTTNRFFFGSTPKGKNNFFYQVMFGDLRVHRIWVWWAEHPYLDLDWYNEQRQDMNDDQIAQELDISFERSAGGRVLPDVDPAVFFTDTASYSPGLDLEVVIDPGFNDPMGIMWFQEDRARGEHRIVDAVQVNRVSIDWIVPFILGHIPLTTYRGEPWPHRYNEIELDIIRRHSEWEAPVLVYGDMAGHSKSVISGTSAFDELDRYGIYVGGVRVQNNKEAIIKLNLFMPHMRASLHLATQRNQHKSVCPTVAEVVTQWRFKKRPENSTSSWMEPVHDLYCHLGDCMKIYAWEKELPEPMVTPASAGRVRRKEIPGIVDPGYRSPFRSR